MDILVRRAKKGDAEAFIELIEQNRSSMTRVARSYLCNEEDVADVLQDTILAAFEKIETLKKSEYFKTWIIRILINNCIKEQRRHNKVIAVEQVDFEQMGDVQASDLVFVDLLRNLPEDSRLIFQLYYGEQFTTAEIAQVLQMKENTVKSKLRRGKEHIKTQIEM